MKLPVFVISLTLAGLLCRPAAAQPADETDARALAKELVAEAQQAFAKQDYESCVDKFRAAFDLAPLPQIRFNLALCLDKLDRHREAAEEYAAASVSEEMPSELRKEARKNLKVVEAKMGKVSFQGTTGQTALVDGLISCDVPCDLFLEPGSHKVQSGTQTQTFKVARGGKHEVELLAPVIADVANPEVEIGEAFVETPANSRVSWLTWGGGGAAVLGTAGSVVFGLRTSSIHDDFMATPTEDLASDGRRMKLLTNASITIAVGGALLVAYDLLTD